MKHRHLVRVLAAHIVALLVLEAGVPATVEAQAESSGEVGVLIVNGREVLPPFGDPVVANDALFIAGTKLLEISGDELLRAQVDGSQTIREPTPLSPSEQIIADLFQVLGSQSPRAETVDELSKDSLDDIKHVLDEDEVSGFVLRNGEIEIQWRDGGTEVVLLRPRSLSNPREQEAVRRLARMHSAGQWVAESLSKGHLVHIVGGTITVVPRMDVDLQELRDAILAVYAGADAEVLAGSPIGPGVVRAIQEYRTRRQVDDE